MSALAALLMPCHSMAQRSMNIDELFELVETGSRSLRSHKTSVDVATKAIDEAKSQRLPDIGAMASASYNGNVVMTDRDFSNAKGFSSPHFGNSFAIEARQTVYSGGATSAAIRVAELQKEQAETAVSQTRSDMRFTALGQYLDLFRADNAIRVYKSNIKLTERLIDDIKAKQAEGMALKNDVTRYELQMETLKLGLRKMEDQRAINNHQLCNTLGLDDTVIKPDTSIIACVYDLGNEAEWQQKALALSPSVKQASIGIELSEQQLRLAKSEMRPKLAAVAADNFSGPFTYDIPPIDKNINVWYVGASLSYSLSSLFKSNKGVARAKAAMQRSKDDYNVATEATDNQTQQAYTMFRQSFYDLRTQQKSVELARQNYDVVNERYLNQLALITDMIDASNVKLSAELKEVDARINITFTYYKLKYIAGDI